MPSDPTKPLLRLEPQEPVDRVAGRQRNIRRPDPFAAERQLQRFGPKFDRLAEVLARDPTGLELRADPTALAPERLLVFEVRGEVSRFSAAVRQVPGLELIDEEELASDDGDKAPVAYLMVPDGRALRELLSLWRRWQRGNIARGETPWRNVFETLRDLRPWGPADRVDQSDTASLSEEIEGRADDERVHIEIELVFRANNEVAARQEAAVVAVITDWEGRVVSKARIEEIGYHALLVELPVRAVRGIVAHAPDGIAGLEPVMHIRPQAVATEIELSDQSPTDETPVSEPTGRPILALLDGVPVAAHPALSRHLIVDDQFGLEPTALVAERVHGTAMASLIVHGDRNRSEGPLPRPIHVVPVLGKGDEFPRDRLIVDLIYTAVSRMRDGAEPTAPDVLIVNISLGNEKRQFHGQVSAWARLLDRLAYRYGILFLVSAGNIKDQFGIPAFATATAFEDAVPEHRSTATVQALDAVKRHRRLLSPAETINGVTVGGSNDDAVPAADRLAARYNVDPYVNIRTANPSSAMGPGFASAVKPDVLMPGAREHLRVIRNHGHIEVKPAGPSRSAGLLVAAPPSGGNAIGFTSGTSAAAALASRTAHRIHDALEFAYGEAFTSLAHNQRAALLKALLVHPARWPDDAAALIRDAVCAGKHHVSQKDDIRRFLGFGFVEADDAVACAADRATFWATGTLGREKTATVQVPVPLAIARRAAPHAITATLAWLTPIAPGRRSYRSVRLQLLESAGLNELQVRADGNQPDLNQTKKGTVFSRRWKGDRAPIVVPGATFDLIVQRDPDAGIVIDEPIPFGLAVTLAMPGVQEIYEEVRARLGIRARIPARA